MTKDERRRTKTLVIDAHEDIAWNMLCYGRDYTQSAAMTRAREADQPDIVTDTGSATLGLPEWIAGKVAVIFATLFSEPARSPFVGKYTRAYSTADEAHTTAMRQLDVYRRLADEHPQFRLIHTQTDLNDVLSAWDGEQERKVGLVMLMENADPIRTPDEVEHWYAEGLRAIGPAWMASRYCGGTGEPGPLTDDGVRLLKHMQDLNMILDLSHMAEQSFFQAVERYDGPTIASHSNPRHYVDGDRHLSDDMIRALIQRDGVIGVVPFNAFLVPDWRRKRGDPKDAADVTTIVRAIDYVCQRAGDAHHAGLGTDLDGGFGAESTPLGIDTVADLQKIGEGLKNAGYAPADIEAILSGNWLRVLRQALPR
jgi:membrane dipeptidase